MISNSMIIQIMMVIVAVAIGWIYIIPTFDAIKDTQSTINTYKTEIEKVNGVNGTLNAAVAKVESMSLNNQQKLNRFMPSSLDEVSVLRELQYLLEQFDLKITSLTYAGIEGATEESFQEGEVLPVVVSPLEKHMFEVGFTAKYSEMKEVLAKLERNDYVFEILSANITPESDNEEDTAATDSVTVLLTVAVSSLPIENLDSVQSENDPSEDSMMLQEAL